MIKRIIPLLLTLLLMTAPALAQQIEASALISFSIRTEPEMTSEKLLEIAAGQMLTMTGEQDGAWVPVRSGETEGWVKRKWLQTGDSFLVEDEQPAGEGTVILPADGEQSRFTDEDDLLEIWYPRLIGADCAILRYGGQVYMIDAATGPQASAYILPLLQSLGIDRIDLALISHPHNDHMQGITTIAGPVKIVTFAYPESFRVSAELKPVRKTLSAMGAEIITVEDGQTIRMGSGENAPSITLIQRATDIKASANNRSMTFLIRFGDRVLYSMSDMETLGQQELLKSLPEVSLRADIIKFPHHGLTRVVTRLLEIIDPELAVFTGSLKTGQWGVEQMELNLIRCLGTYENGICLRTDGKVWEVSVR